MNKHALMKAMAGVADCTCPSAVDRTRAVFEGLELEPHACPIHTAEGMRAAAEAAEAEARRAALAAVHDRNVAEAQAIRAELGQRPPGPDPADPFLAAIQRKVGVPITTTPPASASGTPGLALNASARAMASAAGLGGAGTITTL